MKTRRPIGQVVFSQMDEYDGLRDWAKKKGYSFSAMARVLMLREFHADQRNNLYQPAQQVSEVSV